MRRLLALALSTVFLCGAAYAQAASAPSAVIDTGTIAGQVLTWVVSTFGVVIGGFLTNLLIKMAKTAGLQGADLLRSRLQEIIVNGLNKGVADAAKELAGHGKVEIKNAAIGTAVTYAQVHGADILKELGEDPMAQKTIEAIKARAETAIADPSVATPPILDAPKPADQQSAKG